MVKLKIDSRTYTIDGNPTIDQWMDLMRWDFEAPPHWPHIIKRITDLPMPTIEEMTPEQQHLAVTMIAHSLTQRIEIPLPNFGKLNFGQFVDMEYYLAMGTHKSMRQILETLKIKVDGTQEALWATEVYIKWRNNIYKQYSALFGLDDTYEVDEPQQNKTPQQVAKEWYRILVDLANDDLLAIEEVTNKGVKEVLNFMAVRKERQLEELRKQTQQKRQYDLQRRSR